MDSKSGLSWVLNGESLFVWSHLSRRGPQNCAVLTVPLQFSRDARGSDRNLGESWLICIFGRQTEDFDDASFVKACLSAGVIMCNKKNLSVIYWPDAFVNGNSPICLGPEENVDGNLATNASTDEGRLSTRRSFTSWTGNTGAHVVDVVNSLVASPAFGASIEASAAIAGRSNGDLWRGDCSPDGIIRQTIVRDIPARSYLGLISFNSSCARSVVWRSSSKKEAQQLLLLTASDIEFWNVDLVPGGSTCEERLHASGTSQSKSRRRGLLVLNASSDWRKTSRLSCHLGCGWDGHNHS